MFLISAGKYSKSLSPKYNARRVSVTPGKLINKHSTGWSTSFLTEFEEISWQNIFIQVVVWQIQYLKNRESTEPAKIIRNYSMSSTAALFIC